MINHDALPDNPLADEPMHPSRSHIWMPFGDIVLQVENVQFRVNRDILAHQSTVFAHMFSSPQPEPIETVEGCQLVHLSGDLADDWGHLLDLLYNPFSAEDHLSVPALAAMLFLSRKYEMENIRAHAFSRIHHDYPKTLAAYDAIEENVEILLTRIKYDSGIDVDVLNLVEEYGIKTSLPLVAFLCLRGNTVLCLKDRVVRSDGSHVVLSYSQKRALPVAAECIAREQRLRFHWLEPDDDSVLPSPTCGTHDCGEDRSKIHLVASTPISGRRYSLLSTYHELSRAEHTGVPCYEAAEEKWNEGRKAAWERLPSFFDLPKWGALRDDE
ncbi:BTB domain-containing protein [Mycena kentingensis (nom. inval.)]|nr:BTB domain-containing protein [Mycena kentingensis (nom. inval.)]